MYVRRLITAACACLLPGLALAQSSYLAPDHTNRYPGVTIFCPSGTGVTPCSFGGGGTSGSVSITSGGSAVSSSNRFPVTDTALDALIGGGALTVGGTVSLSGTPSVSLATGSAVSVSLGGSAVSATNRLPVSDTALDALISGGALTVGGTVSLSGTPSVSLATGSAVSVTVGGSAVSSTNRLPVSDSTLDALVSGGALTVGGSVSLSGSPSITLGAGSATVGAVTQSGTWSVELAAGSNAIGSVSVSNLPATQAVSAASLPLPAGAATAAQQAAPFAPVAPGTATATNALVIGCLSNTTLPSFAAGQEGAVPCDSSGRPYVVTVPSQNNVPSYLQAVSSGGATAYRSINAASSTMATNVKSSSGLIYGYETCNSGASAVYFRIFGLTTAPVPGTSTPTISKLLPAGTCQGFSSEVGITIPNGIGYDVTSGSLADSDSTAVATANQVTVQIYYK
jgi:hypothetical protein